MLASPSDDAFIDGRLAREFGQWQFERKYDGYRVAGIATGGVVKLQTRNGVDCTTSYPELAAALEEQPYDDFVIDGEVVALREGGLSSFEQLQQRPAIRAARPGDAEAFPLTYVAFDLLVLDGVDVRGISLERRRRLLADGFEFDDKLVLSPVVDGEGRALLTQACADGWEGLIAKRIESTYAPGRSRHWFKLKCLLRDDFVIAGMTAPKGGRAGFGALVVGTNVGSRLVYAGRVGTGFDDATLRSLRQRLSEDITDERPFDTEPPGLGVVEWVRPSLVCEVGFSEWTSSGQLRHPRYLGLRPDKSPADVEREGSAPIVGFSNVEKIFFPSIDGTKGEVLEYYQLVAELMLAEIADRPLVLERFPNGITEQGFYQKNTPDHTPAYISRLPVSSKSRDLVTYSVIHDATGLLYLANQAALVFHTLLSSAADPFRPIEIIWDLDPSTGDLGPVQLAARLLKERLDELGLAPRVKTTGSKGLHIHVDIIDGPDAGIGYAATKAFAERLAWDLVVDHPDVFTLEFAKKERKGRLLIDVLRNGHASHAAAPYSVRAVPEASVAAPLHWEEALSTDFHPRQFTIRNMVERLAAGVDPWAEREPPSSTVLEAASQLL